MLLPKGLASKTVDRTASFSLSYKLSTHRTALRFAVVLHCTEPPTATSSHCCCCSTLSPSSHFTLRLHTCTTASLHTAQFAVAPPKHALCMCAICPTQSTDLHNTRKSTVSSPSCAAIRLYRGCLIDAINLPLPPSNALVAFQETAKRCH